jgi:hypothetical protein
MLQNQSKKNKQFECKKKKRRERREGGRNLIVEQQKIHPFNLHACVFIPCLFVLNFFHNQFTIYI